MILHIQRAAWPLCGMNARAGWRFRLLEETRLIAHHPYSVRPMDVETIAKIYVKDLRERQPVHTVFKVTKKTHQTGRSGKPFLALTLGDRTGEVDARVFDNVQAIEP